MNLKLLFQKRYYGPGGARELITIALPLVVSNSCVMLMLFTDRLFLSRLSPAHMAAAMGGGLTSFMMVTFILGVHGYGNALVAQHFGAEKKSLCGVVVTQELIISVLAYPLILVCIPLGHKIFAFSGITQNQLVQQTVYFDTIIFGTIIIMIKSSFSSFFSGIGRTRIIMVTAVVTLAANVGLNYVLIFGKLGMPQLGIRGAAIGTVAADAIGAVIIITAYFSHKYRHEFSIMSGWRFDGMVMKELFHRGYPAGLEMLLNLIAFNAMVTIFHSCGEVVATAITITFNWDMVSFIPMIGLNIAVTSLTGRYLGARNMTALKRSAYNGLKLATMYTGMLLIPFLVFTDTLVGVFLPESAGAHHEQVRELSLFMVKMISLYLFCDGVLIVFSGALRGVGDTFWTMTVSIIMHWTFATITFVLLKKFHFDARTTWLVIIGVFFLFGPIMYLRFRSERWIETGALGDLESENETVV